MRILRLRFRNLNSLAGEWDIDFTLPDYVSSGIFAITGPTGAGKTTILDAICVALYGQTPRLNKITQSENEIMSRQTGECFAEVEFETAKGHFRCHWSQHRSRKQASGQLRPPKHEISEALTGNILESKIIAVAKKVEEVTGMDFDRFTRSMLLAQGGFAAFLQATPDRRAPILEQITGTAIYSQVSIKVHECTSEQRKKLDTMKSELSGIKLLAPEEEEQLRHDRSEKLMEEKALSTSLQGIREIQTWKEGITRLEAELAQSGEARRSFEERKLAAAPELECFEPARRAMKLEGAYANVAALRKQQADEQNELVSVEEMLPGARQSLRAAEMALEQAESELKKARDEQQREAELIRKTRELDVKIDEANIQLQGLKTDIEEITRRRDGHRTLILECETKLPASEKLLGDCEFFLSEHRADAGLAEALTGIEQRIKALKTLNKNFTVSQNKLKLQNSACEAAEKTRKHAETDWTAAKQAVAEARDRLEEMQAALIKILQDRELSSWRQETEALSARQRHLGNVDEALKRIEAGKIILHGLQAKLETFEHKRRELVTQEESLNSECALRETAIRQIEEKLSLLYRVRSLEEERAHLVDGVPCPLCGATEHPYAAGNVPRPDDAQLELEHARVEYKENLDRISTIRSESAVVIKEIEQAKREQLDCRERMDSDEVICAVLAELMPTAELTRRDEAVQTELDACQQSISICREVIRGAELLEQAINNAKTSFDTAKESLNLLDRSRHTAQLGLEASVAEQKRLELECVGLRDDSDRALAEVERALEPYGFKDVTSDNANVIFETLTERRKVYDSKLKEKEKIEKLVAELNGSKNREQALLAAAETTLAATDERLTNVTIQRDNLVGQRRELFGERNPDDEEKRLAAALAGADKWRDEANGNQNLLRNQFNLLEQRYARLIESLAARLTRLSELESALLSRITSEGFADENAYLSARLPQDRLDYLSRLTEELQRTELEMQTLRNDRELALQRELDKNLSEKTLDQIIGESSVATAKLSELQKTLGGLDQKLQQHSEQLQRKKDQIDALEMQRTECDRWERLHELIGSSDGKKFRNFAQGLTFELMVAHANRQLQKMNDRYILVRDSDEPLELNVIDNYQAGEIRSTKNLSGGESFIASLALSLGLSSMASRNVSVDSLFLDEGFGTLDEDALETALETLAGLQQDGKLIGIISHVPALKERIGTQIQVDPGSAGRSSLSGPGCQRILNV